MWYLLVTNERVLKTPSRSYCKLLYNGINICFAQIPQTQVFHCFWAIWLVCIPNWYKTEFA